MSFLASTALAALVVGSSFAMPFGASVSSGEREHSAVSAQRAGDGRFSLSFESGGEVVFSEVPMAWGTRYTVEKVAVTDAKSIRIAIVRAPWATERSTFANLLADGRRAVCVRAYDVAASMHCKGDSLWLECDDMRSLVGLRFAIAEGPVDGFRKRLQAMTRDFADVTGVPLPVNGGAFSQTSPATRSSYFMVTPKHDLMDDAIDMAVRTGATVLHFKNWWQTIGHYRANTNLFPRGEADFAAAVAAARAAGLDVSMHSLCTSIGIDDEWVSDGHVAQLKAWQGANYTLAAAIGEDAVELTVNEPIREGHHRTLTYVSNGNVLRIGGELLQYSDFDIPRRKFTGLVRGAFGTRAAAHPAGAATDYVQHRFREFFPVRTSPLVGEISDALVSRYRDGGFVQFYFDGLEGLADRIFEDESCRTIYSGLAAARPPIIEASSYRPHSWWWHSRTGTWDTPVWQLKRFHDLHLKALDDARRIDYLAVGTGWFYPKKSDAYSRGFYRDELEYFAAKNAGRDYPFSTGIGGGFPGRAAAPSFIDAFTIIGWYERLRRTRAFAPGVQEKLNSGRSEWRLRQSASGDWTVRPVTCVQAAPFASAKLCGGEELALRVEPRWGVDNSSVRTLVADIGGVSSGRPFSKSWDFPHASVLPAGVNAATLAGRPAWRLRVKGDGKGGVLRLRVVTPREFGGAEADHLLPLDFVGWKSVVLHDRERDADTDDPWRRYKVFRIVVAPDRISEVSLTLEGGVPRTVEVGSLEALTPVAEKRTEIAVSVNGERFAVPFALSGDEYAELEDGLWRKFDGTGLAVGEAPGPRPRAAAGENAFSVEGGGRATVQVLGQPEPAVAKNLSADQRKVLSREYDFARIWNPADGVVRLEPVVVRPGERARLQVRYVGKPANPVLNVGGVELKEGLNDARFEGLNDISFSCASQDPVRIEIAKVYDESAVPAPTVPVFEEGNVQTLCGGVPVKEFGGTWIYCGAPDIMDDATLQQGNARPREKVAPKPTQELKGNYFGANATRMPCLSANMGLCEEAVHLIDGDAQTCWMSLTQPRCDVQPVTVRIDLAKETEIAKIVLRKRPLLPESRRRRTDRQPTPNACEVGRGLPVEMAVSVSCDAYSWQDVFSGELHDNESKESFEVSFAPRRVKQVRISATKLRLVEFFLYAVSLAEVEVVDSAGRNAALVSRGATIAVDSTFCDGLPLAQQRALWPVQWDLGIKWIRFGSHNDPVNWHRVERVKGRLEVDPVADAAVTACHEHGLNVIMGLSYGNRLYSGPEKIALPQLQEWNFSAPKPPTTPEALAAWDRYVEYMCRHFRDRVHTFEIWNEWNYASYWGDEVDVDAYCEIARRTIPIIRRLAPKCKIMLGSTSGYFGGFASRTPEQVAELEEKNRNFIVWKRFAKDVDAIGYHPFYNPTPGSALNYWRDIEAFREWIGRQGFKGVLHASEWNINGRATPVDKKDETDCWCGTYTQSETAKAKEVLQQMVRHAGYGIPSCFCAMYNAFYAQCELSFFKGALYQSPISQVQPTVSYYALRNAATMMDGFEPADFTVGLSGEGLSGKLVAAYAFSCGGRRGAAVWYEDDKRDDGYRHVPVTLTLPFAAGTLWAYDPMNGVRQRLDCTVEGGQTVIRGLMVGDAPVFVAE